MRRRHTGSARAGDRLARLADDVGRLDAGRTAPAERRLQVLGGVLAPLGVLAILLGWLGAARTSDVYEQVPYLISGGLLGLALVVLGAFLYFSSWLTRLVHDQRAGFAAVADAVDRLAAALDARAPAAPAGGNGPPLVAADAGDDLVVTGSGSLVHRRSCRAVAGRPGVRPAGASEGLAPCRLCHPYDDG